MLKFLRMWTVLALTFAAMAAAGVPLDKLEPPAADKAAVYFFLPGKTPVIPSIAIFDNGVQFPNLVGAREYVRYEVDPGPHTFIVQPHTADLLPGVPAAPPQLDQWVHGDLEAGGIYAALISGFMADLVVHPLPGRFDPELLVNMKLEERQWERVAGLIDTKPPKPHGKKRRQKTNLAYVAGLEARHPTSGFDEIARLNPKTARPTAFPLDQLADPVEGRSVVTFFVPQRKSEMSVTLFDGVLQLGPDLEGGQVYTYEAAAGPTEIWVREVGSDFTRYRVVSGNLEPGRAYGVLVWHSLGDAGARLLTLSGKAETRIAFIPEPELWVSLGDLRDAPRVALQRGDAVDATEMKAIAKKLKKKSKKKRRSVFLALR